MSAEQLAKALESAIGENDEVQEVKHWLDSGYPPLNKIMSGSYDKGLPGGRIIEMYGPSSVGKTALATMFMIAAQKKGGIAGFNDHEKTFQVEMAKQMGLSDEYPYWIYKRPKTWEESNTIAMKAAEAVRKANLIAVDSPILWTFDSVASMIPKSVFEKGIDEYTMNDTTALARVSSATLKAVNSITNELDATMLYLNQVRTKPGVVYGDPSYTPGGSSFEFYASIRLSLSRQRVMEGTGDDKEMTGQIITIKATKNKVARPFAVCKLRMSFGDDSMVKFDFTTSMIEHLIDVGALAYSKPRLTWTDGKQYYVKQLATKIDEEGKYKELEALLPK